MKPRMAINQATWLPWTNGDEQKCPLCNEYVTYFHNDLSPDGDDIVTTEQWICDACKIHWPTHDAIEANRSGS